jgi:hypothetical protein
MRGRPTRRGGWVQWRAMRSRCQRNNVSGLTRTTDQHRRSRYHASAASSARSAAVANRGRLVWRRSTASWWRRTRMSMSLEQFGRAREAQDSQDQPDETVEELHRGRRSWRRERPAHRTRAGFSAPTGCGTRRQLASTSTELRSPLKTARSSGPTTSETAPTGPAANRPSKPGLDAVRWRAHPTAEHECEHQHQHQRQHQERGGSGPARAGGRPWPSRGSSDARRASDRPDGYGGFFFGCASWRRCMSCAGTQSW